METFSQHLSEYVLPIGLTMGGYLLALIFIPRILLDRRGPEATLAWIMLIAFLPYLGAGLFYLFGSTRIRRHKRKKLQSHHEFQKSLTRIYPPPKAPPFFMPPHLPRTGRNIARLAEKLVEADPVPGNRVQLFIDGEKAYRSMEQAILEARRQIHMMSYIFRQDRTGQHFLKLLTAKAEQGVQVRLLVDGFGASEIGRQFTAPLIAAGGRFARFNPILGYRGRLHLNLRNHRKILVVDDRIGFTGGLNVGDEYQGRKKKFAPWRDTHLRIEGRAVRQLQEVFAEDWFYITDENLAIPDHFPDIPACGRELVQIMSSGPDHDHSTIHAVFFSAINEADKSIHITTPYFIPDPAMLLALKTAAWRGVDVKLLLPGKSDAPLVKLAGQSYYMELLEAGVKLYEHRPGILHAKTMVVDGIWCTVGSANMDIRSFKLNYEVNALVWGSDFAERLENIFAGDIEGLEPITMKSLTERPTSIKLAESLTRVLSPVL